MELCDITPFLRYAELQSSVISSAPLRCSYDYRIFYILDGTATLVLAQRSIPLAAGMLVYLRPGTPYYFEGSINIIVLNFDMTRRQAHQREARAPSKDLAAFDAQQIFENDPPAGLREVTILPQAAEIEAVLQKCVLHYRYPNSFSNALTSALLKELLCFIVQRSSVRQDSPPEIVQRILLFIQKNCDRPISNADISAAFGYHSFYLNRVFKKHTGATLHQAVLAEKMHVAGQLLQETALSVDAVAAGVGFTDRPQFCTAFKKHTGFTPTEYRRKNGTQEP